MSSKTFIKKLDLIKQKIEAKYYKEFLQLYKRIGNDLINILQSKQSVNFNIILENYKPDYISIFRRIYQDVKNKVGFNVREQLKFNLSRQIMLKSSLISPQDQDKINDAFDLAYTTLLNNETEKLASKDFIESEAKYFETLYSKSIQSYDDFLEQQRQQEARNRAEIFALLLLPNPSKVQMERVKYLEIRNEALQNSIENISEQKTRIILQYFKTELAKKIPIRSQGSAEYVVGRASSEVRELEYQTIQTSNVNINTSAGAGALVALRSLISKVWTHYSKQNPRPSHVVLDGITANQDGNFNVNGYIAPHPRHASLPASESINCRCEAEYKVKLP